VTYPRARSIFAGPRQLRLLALGLLPFVACFAEPHPVGPNDPDASADSGQAGASPSAGGRAGSQAGGRGGSVDGSGGSSSGNGPGGSDPGDGGSSGEEGVVSTFCHEVAAEPLPARKAIMSDKAPDPDVTGPRVLTLTKESLYQEFQKQTCGSASCHGGESDPDGDPFKLTLESFDQRPTLGTEALERILSTNPDEWMPPESKGGAGLGPDHPLRKLGERLLAWQEKGFPPSFQITLDSGTNNSNADAPYLISPKLGKRLTNLGSCVPDMAVMLNPVADEIAAKDALFAAMQTSDDLPDTLYETDLVSLDSAELSRRGVFSYAPTYPLYSDHAGKMRYVRVPVGEKIHYDPEVRDFAIPDNTRFYKTFLKDVRDESGDIGHRKMETRLIVVRQDEKLPGGGYRTRALRASYAWNKDETMAHRVKDPFRSGAPAADRMCAYVVDESVTRDPTKNPISPEVNRETCDYMTEAEMNNPDSGQIRHYAIPSTDRCDQCHMGSSSRSYILGFTPWQVDRRKAGEGGIYEDPKGDELTQLQRLIDYGLITGIEPGQAKLEESQLIAEPPRPPRNDYELKAQGYMLGNCAFCHNPEGYPVVTNPVLKDFELFPSKTGGIFQFSLERYSPRAKAGKGQDHRIPYITAAFGDFVFTDGYVVTKDAKVLEYDPADAPIIDATASPPPPDFIYPFFSPTSPYYRPPYFTFLGPWRSLIWRNVYTPFTYAEEGTIFIHMPRNVAGYDCRAPKIMADWMLSIPVINKPEIIPDTQPSPTPPQNYPDQPVVEVGPSNTVFDQLLASREAEERLAAYATSVTGSWCPSDDDIVDLKVVLSPTDPETDRPLQSYPVDEPITHPRVDPGNIYTYQLLDMVPDRAQWVPTDTTDLPGRWVPREKDWKSIIATREVEVSEQLNAVIDELQTVTLSQELSDFALEPLPMGVWDPRCQSHPDVAAAPTVADMKHDLDLPLHRWLGGGVVVGDAKALATDHVHRQSRGEAVFRAICQNCHGRAIDSNSALAATISELTGGQTRVANFVQGLFGPASAPGAFARDEFAIGYGATPSEWQARYVLYMGLGGTRAQIPSAVLNLVALSGFYGQGVTAPGGDNPNMLGSAQRMCYGILAGSGRSLPEKRGNVADPLPAPKVVNSADSSFAKGTAHYELWESLCTFQNEPVVRVFKKIGTDTIYQANAHSTTFRAKDDAGNWIYPVDALVGNQRGEVQVGIQPSNSSPWCIKDSAENANQYWTEKLQMPGSPPLCPEVLFTTALGNQIYNLKFIASLGVGNPDVPFGNAEFSDRWMRKGAITAGLAAFHHMRGFIQGDVQPSQPFDFCAQ
jgi:mono/diheme cytochrome c family protein